MLVPYEHLTELELSDQMKAEFIELKDTILNDDYSFVIETLPKQKSIPRHMHYHLIVPHDEI